MSSSEEFTLYDDRYVNPNIMRPQDTAMMEANLHHLSAARPLGRAVIEANIVIREIGYVQPVAPRQISLPPRYVDAYWDNRPA